MDIIQQSKMEKYRVAWVPVSIQTSCLLSAYRTRSLGAHNLSPAALLLPVLLLLLMPRSVPPVPTVLVLVPVPEYVPLYYLLLMLQSVSPVPCNIMVQVLQPVPVLLLLALMLKSVPLYC